ncbi:hypothetical protein BDW75DRAFT_237955 [Aspergillus navahoensis]
MSTVLQLTPNTWTRMKLRSACRKLDRVQRQLHPEHLQRLDGPTLLPALNPAVGSAVAARSQELEQKALLGHKIAQLLADLEAQKLAPTKEKIPNGGLPDGTDIRAEDFHPNLKDIKVEFETVGASSGFNTVGEVH